MEGLNRSTPARAALWLVVLVGAGCSADMAVQPSVRPGETSIRLPAGVVPVTGLEDPVDSMMVFMELSNPIDVNEETIARGEELFSRFCAPCHGPEAKGGGPMVPYFGEPPPLSDPANLDLPDGFFYSTIRHGRGMMPALGEMLTSDERWALVHYLRRLQGR